MKVRIGVGPGQGFLDPESLGRLADDIEELELDSIWLAEVLTAPTVEPLTALSWLAARNPDLKLGTTMVLPGRNPVRLAKEIGTLDVLSGGRLLVTFVPGLAVGRERTAIGVAPDERGERMEEVMPLLRGLWDGEVVTHDGPAGSYREVSVSPLPVQEPFEVWLGGVARSSLERCGRLFDGWLPAMVTPEEAAQGHEVVNDAAAASGRSISPEHFGVSIAYADGPVPDAVAEALAARAKGRPLSALVPEGHQRLRDLLEAFIDVGFSKFVVRPVLPPRHWRSELEGLVEAVGDLQST